MLAIALLLCIPLIMWSVQTILLVAHGLPIRMRIDSGGAPKVVRVAGRIVTQATLVGFAVAYPLLRGETVSDYYAALFPMNETARDMAHGAALTTLILSALYLVWLAFDQMRVAPYIDWPRTARRLALAPFSAAFGAIMEEIVFRGVVMANLMRSGSLSIFAVIAVSAVIFAGAHYVRSVKRRWTIFGHLALGLLLSVAYWRTENLWLCTGLHAGGILMIMGTRPILKYRSPPWLTGASIYPYAGIVGIFGLAMLTWMVIRRYPA